MKMIRLNFALMMFLISLPLLTLAGSLEPPGPPGSMSSAMYRVEDICQRLKTGVEPELKPFRGPTSGPGASSGCTLNDVMGVAPKKDEASGAQASEVLMGKSYWGLRAEQWGKQTGTMVDQGAPTYMPSTEDQMIAAGYHNGQGIVRGDEDLRSANLKEGVELFGVKGSYNPLVSTGDVHEESVLAGKTFSNEHGTDLVGTMVNQGAKNYTPSANDQPIAAGYYDGSGVVKGDANLISSNIKAGVKIFGVSGDKHVVDTSSGNANSSYLLEGQKAWVKGKEITGSLSLQNLVNTSSGDALASEIITGKKAWVDGVEVTGTRPLAPVSKTGQTTSYAAGDDGTHQQGVTMSPRFTDNGDGTVKDNLTGLIWLKKANCIGTDNSSSDADGTIGDGMVYWQTALNFVTNLNATPANCGVTQTDWRLPNLKELQSLIDYGQSNPALPSGHPFSGVQSDHYWSATTVASSSTSLAWGVNLGYGSVVTNDKTGPYYVWPVRGGQ
ncbi:MAG: DUF1566 domain-containing protein [Thioploca sp.]|nr:DUF1566 domain-containing protein [Thioploca sp.]